MSVLWVVPLVVLTVGTVLVVVTLRTTTDAAVELRDECAQLDELRAALVALRHDADLTRGAVDQVRARARRRPPDH